MKYLIIEGNKIKASDISLISGLRTMDKKGCLYGFIIITKEDQINISLNNCKSKREAEDAQQKYIDKWKKMTLSPDEYSTYEKIKKREKNTETTILMNDCFNELQKEVLAVISEGGYTEVKVCYHDEREGEDPTFLCVLKTTKGW